MLPTPFTGPALLLGGGRGQGSFPTTWRPGRRRSSISDVTSERKRQRIAAYGVCRDADGRLLLARASSSLTVRGRWFLPGGGVQHGESPPDSLRREMEEETGLAVVVGPLLDVLSDVRTVPPERTNLHTVRLIYQVDSWDGAAPPRDQRHDGRRRLVHARRAGHPPPGAVRHDGGGSAVVSGTDATRERHHVVIIGSGFGGLFAAAGLEAGTGPGDADRPDEPSSLPALALPGGDGHPLGGADRAADPRRPAQPPAPARGPGGRAAHRRRCPHRPCRRVRAAPRHRLRQLDRGRRCRDLVLRARRVPASGPAA